MVSELSGWLRGTRKEPPSVDELKANEERLAILSERVKRINERDAKERELYLSVRNSIIIDL